MQVEMVGVAPPAQGVYRLARRPGEVFAPPSWKFADPADGTFKNRFDDPSLDKGNGPDRRFRVIYCATSRACALMESTAQFRRSMSTLARLRIDVEDVDEGPGDILSEALDPEDPQRGILSANWRLHRQIGQNPAGPALRFVDVTATATLNHLRYALADVVMELGLQDIDLSAVTGPQRTLTQRIARHVYDQVDPEGRPRFAGIRYLSHYGGDHECWAIFDTRMVHHDTYVEQTLLPDDPDLLSVAHAFGLTIEVLNGHYLRP